MRASRILFVLGFFGLVVAAAGCSGKDGADGTSCSVTANADGSTTIACDDGTTVVIPPPTDGTSCTVMSNGDGTSTITCEDGTVVIVSDGTDGTSCTIVDNGDGTKTITCEDGTTVTVSDGDPGPPGGNVEITDLHGEDFLNSTGEFAEGKFFADATITAATADAAGQVVVDFTVERASGDPVLDVPSISANIVKLAPPPTGEASTRWVPYLYRTETVSGSGFPNPNGTQAIQGYREGNGTLVNHGDGSYTYTFATNISNVTVGGNPITYDRSLKHRVSIMMGGHAGATATAHYDFVPDGSTVTTTRDIVRTETCKNCHGDEFHGHGGDRLTVENCVTCHNPSSTDAQGGESLDAKVMIHKIHMGAELPTFAGADGNPWQTADNGAGPYTIWGFGNRPHTWWEAGFPAHVNNCEKCHDGSGADSDTWKQVPSRATCGSCHDDVNFVTGTNHAAGPQANDNNCATCHPPDTGFAPIVWAHDAFGTDPTGPIYDDRHKPEFTLDVTMSAPANGTDYRGNEAPVVSIVINRNGTPLADHNILSGTAQGCTHVTDPVLCDADTDGRFANAAFFVTGPRAEAKPALTTAARSQLFSTTTGPFDISAAGASLTVRLDQGTAIYLSDAWHTRVPGVVTIPVSDGTWATSTASVTTDEIVTWLNGDAEFAARALAWNDAGRVGIRSRNLGKVFGIQLDAGPVTSAVFGGDTAVHMPSGFTPTNQLTSTSDPKVTRFTDHIEYALDPVTDLPSGTYTVNLEITQLGRVSGTNYKTPSVKRFWFHVKRDDGAGGFAGEEKKVAGNCNSCHQAAAGDQQAFRGFVLDFARHYKIFDDTAVDQCHACHDYLPASAVDSTGAGRWMGAKPISRRVHAIHFGSSLNYPLATVDYGNGDPVTGRDWNITFPQDVRNCQSCHADGTTSGSWASQASRLPCSGCHDADAAMTHMRLMTLDPTPDDPWSGDEVESCKACH